MHDESVLSDLLNDLILLLIKKYWNHVAAQLMIKH